MSTDTAKDQFIDDYVQAALESPQDHRNPDQIYSDGEAEWEGSQIDTAKQAEQEQWVLVQRLGGTAVNWSREIEPAVMVLVDFHMGGSPRSAVMRAMRDPSNVYRVQAYPEVVKALKECINRLRNQGGDISEITHNINMSVARDSDTALSAVHPQGDKP